MDITIEYIRGWFDRSSSINIRTSSLSARSYAEWPARAIFGKLLQMGIDCSFTKYDKTYEIRIGKKEALKKWNDLIGFIDKEKALRLSELL